MNGIIVIVIYKTIHWYYSKSIVMKIFHFFCKQIDIITIRCSTVIYRMIRYYGNSIDYSIFIKSGLTINNSNKFIKYFNIVMSIRRVSRIMTPLFERISIVNDKDPRLKMCYNHSFVGSIVLFGIPGSFYFCCL